MELRQHPRVRVRFRSSFSAPQMAAGEGLVQDLSLGGCRVESPTPVQPGTELELRIAVPQEMTPVAVERAVVRWARGREFGVAFLSLRPPEQDRLHDLARELGIGPTQ
ncbi:MAG: PilZ domain-containing protein [Nitrospiraceae bacterium]